MKSNSLDRRAFIAGSSATVATFFLSCDKKPDSSEKTTPDASTTRSKISSPEKPTSFEILGAEEVVTLAAFLNRILPAVEEVGAPSAVDLDVMYYIDGQLRLESFASIREMIIRGLKLLEVASKKFHGGSFHTREVDVQDQVLRDFQNGAVKALRFPQARFFSQLKAFALEGYWGSPKYGGNKDRQAWAWVEINPQCSHIYDRCSE